jgi:hypothetical protein
MLRLSNIRIGTKLAIMSVIAILLVAGMALSQYMANNAINALNAVEDQALGVRSSVNQAQINILRTWIARRNVLLAQSIPEADAALKLLRDNTIAGQGQLDKAIAVAPLPEDRERLKELKSTFAEYIDSTEVQASAHKDILGLRKRQIDTTPAWNTAYAAVAASPELANPEIQADIRDGVLSMKDARIAYWRYSTLLDDEFTVTMHAAAAKSIASFNHAKGMTTDAGVKGGLDGVLAVMGELNAIMDGAK